MKLIKLFEKVIKWMGKSKARKVLVISITCILYPIIFAVTIACLPLLILWLMHLSNQIQQQQPGKGIKNGGRCVDPEKYAYMRKSWYD